MSLMETPTLPVEMKDQPSGTKPNYRHAVLIVNTKSRQGESWFGDAQKTLKEMGVPLRHAHGLRDPSRLTQTVETSLREGADLLIIGGGDGSFRTVANRIARSETTLGILPLGTVNDFARNLGIESTLQEACQVIADGYTADVDLCRAGDKHFLITASIGYSADAQAYLTSDLKRRFGPFGYLIAGIKAIRSIKPFAVTIRHANGTETLQSVQAGVISGKYWMGGSVEIPGVSIDGGKFAFYSVAPQSGWQIFQLYRALKRRQFYRTPGLRAFRTDAITLETASPQKVVLDGDIDGETPLELSVAHNALKVCVPKP
jgi:diacylglycerol kinase (ATP)